MAEDSEPLYRVVARKLHTDIQNGKFPVGTRLPTEHELSQSLKVSRHTVREALRHLRTAGSIASRQGSGWIVTPPSQNQRYVHAVSDLMELLQYSAETRLVVDSSEIVTTDTRLASRLGCRFRRKWLRLVGLNYEPGNDVPVSFTEIFIHEGFAKIQGMAGKVRKPLYGLIEDEYGERVGEVRQTMRATIITSDRAARLQAIAGSAALELERHYISDRGKTMYISFSLRPADRFSYTVSLRRQATA